MSLDLQEEFSEIVTQQIKRFAKWAGKNWTLDPSDQLLMLRDGHSTEYMKGYNAALVGLVLALDAWIEDGGPAQ